MPAIISIRGEPTDSKPFYHTAGAVYIGLYGLLLLLILWRMYKYAQATKVSMRCIKCSTKGDIFRDKNLAVHVLLGLFAIFDIIHGVGCFVLGRIDYRLYTAHLLAFFCFSTAFCLIPPVLNDALQFGGAYYYVRKSCRAAVGIVFVVTAVSIGIELNNQGDSSATIDRAYLLLWGLSSGLSFLLSVWMLIYAVRMTLFFCKTAPRTVMTQANHERYLAIMKILTVVIILALCSLFRSICSVLLILEYTKIIIDGTRYISDMVFMLVSQWIPFTVAGCVMLYVCTPTDQRGRAPARNRLVNRDHESTSLTSPLKESTSGGIGIVNQTQSSDVFESEATNPVMEMAAYEKTDSHLVRVISSGADPSLPYFEGDGPDSWMEST